MTLCNESGARSRARKFATEAIVCHLASEKLRQFSALGFGGAFVWVGIQHFTNTVFFTPIVPQILGFPEFWVYVSGLVEIILGLGLILPVSRRRAGFSTALFLILVYCANLNMWVNDITISGTNFFDKWALASIDSTTWNGLASAVDCAMACEKRMLSFKSLRRRK